MKIIQIITIGISIGMLFMTIGIFLNTAVDAKYNAVSQTDLETALTFSKTLLGYIILVLFVLTATVFQKKKKGKITKQST
jgi:hypothetical protein